MVWKSVSSHGEECRGVTSWEEEMATIGGPRGEKMYIAKTKAVLTQSERMEQRKLPAWKESTYARSQGWNLAQENGNCRKVLQDTHGISNLWSVKFDSV